MSEYFCTWENGICTKCGESNPVPHIPNVINYCNATKKKEPTFTRKAINISKAVARIVTSTEPLIVPPETYENRLKICNDCQHYNSIKEACNKCGCSLKGKVLNKAKYATESCPVGKW